MELHAKLWCAATLAACLLISTSSGRVISRQYGSTETGISRLQLATASSQNTITIGQLQQNPIMIQSAPINNAMTVNAEMINRPIVVAEKVKPLMSNNNRREEMIRQIYKNIATATNKNPVFTNAQFGQAENTAALKEISASSGPTKDVLTGGFSARYFLPQQMSTRVQPQPSPVKSTVQIMSRQQVEMVQRQQAVHERKQSSTQELMRQSAERQEVSQAQNERQQVDRQSNKGQQFRGHMTFRKQESAKQMMAERLAEGRTIEAHQQNEQPAQRMQSRGRMDMRQRNERVQAASTQQAEQQNRTEQQEERQVERQQNMRQQIEQGERQAERQQDVRQQVEQQSPRQGMRQQSKGQQETRQRSGKQMEARREQGSKQNEETKQPQFGERMNAQEPRREQAEQVSNMEMMIKKIQEKEQRAENIKTNIPESERQEENNGNQQNDDQAANKQAENAGQEEGEQQEERRENSQRGDTYNGASLKFSGYQGEERRQPSESQDQNNDEYGQYQFEYYVSDPHTHDVKQQKESSDGHSIKGQYSLVQPDGMMRTVDYTANKKEGFQANVQYIPAPKLDEHRQATSAISFNLGKRNY